MSLVQINVSINHQVSCFSLLTSANHLLALVFLASLLKVTKKGLRHITFALSLCFVGIFLPLFLYASTLELA